ncbi:helicase HerA domain-containing protein [Campylobacter mucosalis]|uniref:helicase HerA domain-containing protein n=1 Tax=Campylobacter mucosalis TaxID=202 RepID=UPI00068DC2BC|nr:helicase HerA-like domain-containing protein [Campylobacter mucosalis]
MSDKFLLGIKDNEPFFYKSSDLNTHALIVGMTGSGKTGLGVTLLEEICLKNIPSFVIDPKGDMANLCLSLKNADEFLPYAKDKDTAENLANSLKIGLENSFGSLARVSEFKDSVDFTIYTPKSSSGVGVALLGDFTLPQNLDDEAMINYINSLTSSILSLVSLQNDDTSKEYILINEILISTFKQGKILTLNELILTLNEPPFSQIGVFEIEKFYPANERFKLSVKLNSLIASANFKAYTNGERLDIKNMLFNGKKAKCNIFSISHLNDNERMFFVTFLLNEIIAWLRTTEGTDELRAVF